ncbi:hypothetical protein [Sporisorium scitamineum]|uniref:Translation elongation factor EF1B beta/delta subunit guanine nucleotide exchange domain-containing protein n=1 Tax=Sporisorium scitamineum TaxID=49012 RepID=A0A0F7S1U2_9BASI|nr:hypothetical protein [Sporisorium scitamineum]
MSLPDFSQAANLTKLDGFLADKSYVDGHSPSQADVAVYEAIGKAPEADKYSHVDEEAERIKAERVAEYNKKKAAKGPGPAAKSLVTLDIKPWDDETDMKELEASVRAIEMDGLVWGSSKLVAIGYGVSKLQCSLVVEDAKVSLDELQERIADECEDYVQSTDIAAMAKI